MVDRSALRPTGAVRGLAALGGLILGLPIIALAVRGGIAELGAVLASPAIRTALRVTITTSSMATVIAVLTGVPLALVAARGSGLSRRLASAASELPLVIPPVVTGLALLLTFGREGLLGGALDAAGIRVTFTSAAVVLAQASVAIPLVVLAVRAGVAAMDPTPEQASATLGATPWQVLRIATLPALRAPIALGAALAWGRAAGEFGATLTFAGSLPGRTRTLPLAVFAELQESPQRAAAAALVQIGLAVLVLAVARRLAVPRGAS